MERSQVCRRDRSDSQVKDTCAKQVLPFFEFLLILYLLSVAPRISLSGESVISYPIQMSRDKTRRSISRRIDTISRTGAAGLDFIGGRLFRENVGRLRRDREFSWQDESRSIRTRSLSFSLHSFSGRPVVPSHPSAPRSLRVSFRFASLRISDRWNRFSLLLAPLAE